MRTGKKMKKPSRGRPRRYDPDIALQNALDLFWQNGFAATSLDNLAQATSMNRPSLYAAFGNKKSLYMKAFEHFERKLKEKLVEINQSRQPLMDDMKDFFDLFIDTYTKDQLGCFVINTATVEAANDTDIRDKLATIISDSDSKVEMRLQKALENNELKKGSNPAVLAKILCAILNSLSIRARAGTSPKELRKFAHDALKELLK